MFAFFAPLRSVHTSSFACDAGVVMRSCEAGIHSKPSSIQSRFCIVSANAGGALISVWMTLALALAEAGAEGAGPAAGGFEGAPMPSEGDRQRIGGRLAAFPRYGEFALLKFQFFPTGRK